jgi:hypothetical protein
VAWPCIWNGRKSWSAALFYFNYFNMIFTVCIQGCHEPVKRVVFLMNEYQFSQFCKIMYFLQKNKWNLLFHTDIYMRLICDIVHLLLWSYTAFCDSNKNSTY